MATLDLMAEAARWVDTTECAADTINRFTALVDADPELKAHRDFVEKHVYGFGERAFHWMWKLLVDAMPAEFRFLEIGVYKGQVPSLIRLLADRTGRQAGIVGVTPLSSFGGDYDTYPDEDYRQHIKDLHAHFDQELPKIVKGDSTSARVAQVVTEMDPFDLVYIDGCHDYEYVVKDILRYGSRVKEGGYLVIDDASCYLAPVWGHYQGIQDVCAAVRATIETDTAWEHLLAVMHDRVWCKIGPMGAETREPPPIQAYRWVGGPDGNVAVKV